jgi:hypothetical protein
VITPKVERQLDALLDVVSQERAALAVGISRRSVQRYAARRRKEGEPQSLEQLLASLPTFEEIMPTTAAAVRLPHVAGGARASGAGRSSRRCWRRKRRNDGGRPPTSDAARSQGGEPLDGRSESEDCSLQSSP